MNNDCKQLIAHINRIEGQLEAVKRELAAKDVDCEKASKVILAASRSFATFRMTFIKTFLKVKFDIEARGEQESLIQNLLSIIKG